MELIIVLAVFGFLVLAIQFVAKKLLRGIERFENSQAQNKNPYIQYHKFKNDNDKNYDDYLNWLNKKGDGVPVDKVVMPEDKKADSKIKNLL